MITGSLTLHTRLPSLRIQARSLGYSAVSANRAGSQSTVKLRQTGLSSGWDGFPSEAMILLAPPTKIRTISIIQDALYKPSDSLLPSAPRLLILSQNVNSLARLRTRHVLVLILSIKNGVNKEIILLARRGVMHIAHAGNSCDAHKLISSEIKKSLRGERFRSEEKLS